MRPERCGECGDDFVWDSDAGSAVCPTCGTLQDPSQVVLDAHIDQEDNAKERNAFPFSFYQRATLKNFRNAHGWDLAGQEKQAAAERNKIAMRGFTTTLAQRIGHPSLAARAVCLFELAMQRGHFRYGTKARLVAGASLAIALREGEKGETVRDIAYLLNDSHVAVARVLTAITSLLGLKLVSVDPSWHLPGLQRHLVSLLTEGSPYITSTLIRTLKNIHFPSAFRLATSLSELVSRAGFLATLPSPATACAIYMLALEGENLDSLPQCGALARILGNRLGINAEAVMRRYRSIHEQIEEWATEIPWMDYSKEPTKGKTRAKVAKKAGLARCLKDVVQSQESKWKTKLEATEPLGFSSDVRETVSSSEISSVSEVDLLQNDEATRSGPSRPRKRRKITPIDDVSHFLLSPLHARPTEKPYIDYLPRLEAVLHMLTSEVPSFNRPPTRLQLLAASKPIDDITDEELFEEGELESFLRSTEEKEALIQTCDWARVKDDREADMVEARASRVQRDTHTRDYTSRLNIEALSNLIDEKDAVDWIETTDKDDDDDDNWAMSLFPSQIMGEHATGSEDNPCETIPIAKDDSQTSFSATDDNGEILGPWRPLSPDSK